MSDETTIPPAMTPEEWARCGFDHSALNAERFRDLFLGRPTGNLGVRIKHDLWATETPQECHTLAALCLYGQPFGFTQEEVTALRESAEDDHAAYEHHATLRSLAAKLAALLPPAP